jgi:small subunit ribosomal protein S10
MKFRIFLKSFDKSLIDSVAKHLIQTLSQTECNVSGIVTLPKKIKRFCILRSPHVDKDSREHFEIRLYKKFIDIQTNSPTVLDFLLKTEVSPGVSCSLKVLTTN